MRDLVSTGAQRARMMVGMDTTATKPPQGADHDGCPRCDSTEVFARGHRRGPDEYQCLSCGSRWDGPESGPPVLVGPPLIIGSDAHGVPTRDVVVPTELIYVPDGDT